MHLFGPNSFTFFDLINFCPGRLGLRTKTFHLRVCGLLWSLVKSMAVIFVATLGPTGGVYPCCALLQRSATVSESGGSECTAQKVSGTSQGFRECSRMRHQCIFPRYFAPVDCAFAGSRGSKNANTKNMSLQKQVKNALWMAQCTSVQSHPKQSKPHSSPSAPILLCLLLFLLLFPSLSLSFSLSFSAQEIQLL